MRKTALCLSACLLLAACQSETKKDGAAAKEASPAVPNADGTAGGQVAAANRAQGDTGAPETGPVAPAVKLMTAADCAGCHQEREKVVGPAYAAIARKYPATDANVAMLAGRIIAGGKGHWGEIPMTPHPGLPLADAKEMARYILSLQ